MDDNMVKVCIQIKMERQNKEFGKMEKESDGSMIMLEMNNYAINYFLIHELRMIIKH